MKRTITIVALLLATSTLESRAAEKVDPATFDQDGDHCLSEAELSHYVIKRDGLKPDIGAFMTDDFMLKPNAEELIRNNLVEQAAFKVGEIYAKLGEANQPPRPVSVALVQKVEIARANPDRDKPLALPGIYAEPKKMTNGSIGPFLLRRKPSDWDAADKAQGAKVAFSNDREADKTTWTTEGALIYPIALAFDYSSYDRENLIRSERWMLVPSVSWKVNKIADTQNGDIEELQGQVPVVWSANHVNMGWLRNSEIALSPFVLTDFSLQGLVWGAKASYSPVILSDNTAFGLNAGYKGLGHSPFLYRIGLAPSLDYSHLSETSRFIARNGKDSYFRAGGKAELGLMTMGYPAVELLGVYEALAGISGAPDYSDLWSASAKLWLSENAGFSVEYQNGDTPVAQKRVDLFTAGFELKF